MPRARKEPPPPPAKAGPARRLAQFALPVLAGAAALAAVVWLGRLTRDDLSAERLTFADVQCQPPPGMTREEFLVEAQYLAGLPDGLDVRDEATADRVRQALAGHPWVREARVRVWRGGVRAEVEYRTAVLWVAAKERAVDGQGVLLPISAGLEGLPVMAGAVRPFGRAGQPWGDADVEAAAKVVGVLAERRDAIGLGRFAVWVDEGVVVLRRDRQRIVWGKPPGQEAPGEPAVEAKVARLLELARTGGDADLRK